MQTKLRIVTRGDDSESCHSANRAIADAFSVIVLILGVIAGTSSAKIDVPMNVDLSINGTPSLFQTVDLSFTVTPLVDAKDTEIQFEFPVGIKLIGGQTTWRGDIAKDETVELNVSIQCVENGNWELKAQALSYQGDYPWEKADFVYISVNNESGIVSDIPFVSRTSMRATRLDPNIMMEQPPIKLYPIVKTKKWRF